MVGIEKLAILATQRRFHMTLFSTPHRQMPAIDFLQKHLKKDSDRTVTLICSRPHVDSESQTLLDFGEGRRIFVFLHGYKWYCGVDMEPGKTISTTVQINPTLSKDRRAIFWGLNELQNQVSGLYNDGHADRFPWSWTTKFFGDQSPVWLEYQRRRMCENAHERAVNSMKSALRYASQPPFITDL